jgi:hypothetical protein
MSMFLVQKYWQGWSLQKIVAQNKFPTKIGKLLHNSNSTGIVFWDVFRCILLEFCRRPFETSINCYDTTRYHFPVDSVLISRHLQNLGSDNCKLNYIKKENHLCPKRNVLVHNLKMLQWNRQHEFATTIGRILFLPPITLSCISCRTCYKTFFKNFLFC